MIWNINKYHLRDYNLLQREAIPKEYISFCLILFFV